MLNGCKRDTPGSPANYTVRIDGGHIITYFPVQRDLLDYESISFLGKPADIKYFRRMDFV